MSSLSTQIARGTLALPMLLMFAGLGVVAVRQQAVDPIEAAKVDVMAQVCKVPVRPVLVLAQAPADLGRLGVRLSQSCRA